MTWLSFVVLGIALLAAGLIVFAPRLRYVVIRLRRSH
jgi:hypothetical protein